MKGTGSNHRTISLFVSFDMSFLRTHTYGGAEEEEDMKLARDVGSLGFLLSSLYFFSVCLCVFVVSFFPFFFLYILGNEDACIIDCAVTVYVGTKDEHTSREHISLKADCDDKSIENTALLPGQVDCIFLSSVCLSRVFIYTHMC